MRPEQSFRLDDILSQVQKPGRYIGQEWNLPQKDFNKAEIKFALCFPDLYEVGMSNLGLRIIYGILNNIPDVSCERFFSCGQDLESILRKSHIEIFSLESQRRLNEFDIIGFSLAYELNYTNVLNILDLGAIPLKSWQRGPDYPLVIGGGPCSVNPEPMHEFFDLFVIGEGEEVILEVIGIYRKFKDKFKASQVSKEDFLALFSNIEGVYVPSLYEVLYEANGRIKEFRARNKNAPLKIKKRFVTDLNRAYFPLAWLMPYIQTIHDRITLEIMRGCPNRCRFCQARSYYFPYRMRDSKTILNLAGSAYARTGYEELSLCGLSVSDYANLEKLLPQLMSLCQKDAVSVSLPSIKPNALLGSLSSLIATIKKTSLTFAPEAATERLRKILAKDFDCESLFKVTEQAYTLGYRHIKLYFMIGLPYEEESDLDALLDFADEVSNLRKKTGKGPAQINISVNTLIPKPHTALQWLQMQDLEGIRYKQRYLKAKIKEYLTCSGRQERLRLRLHNPQMSFLEGVLSRGDRRLSDVIVNAFDKGARFDAWENNFVFARWTQAFSECKVDPNFYLQEKLKDEYLPWDFLEMGISKDALSKEYDKLIARE